MYFNYDAVSVYYTKQGTGKNLLLLHGWGADSRVFSGLINHYKKQVYGNGSGFPAFWRVGGA